ncbi:MAG: DUF5063 domain-containing protein [Bacteroidales bacterium]|nr:DUF5063 domain-containing protein [Bacteroidales bacterium]
MQDESEIIERQLIDLFTLSGEYCIAVEKAGQSGKDEIMSFLSKLAPILYLKGLLFQAQPEPEEGLNETFVTEEQWEEVFNTLRNLFGDDDRIAYAQPGSKDGTEIIQGSLAELFADAYQDLKNFVFLMTKNSILSKQYASYNIKADFEANWGFKLLQAQIFLHQRILMKTDEPDYSDLD